MSYKLKKIVALQMFNPRINYPSKIEKNLSNQKIC
jgi:hypothetical protein